MELKLPTSVISQSDVTRLIRELSSLEDFFATAAVRKTGTPMQLPKLTSSLNQLAKANNRNLLTQAERQQLIAVLKEVVAKAPSLHISFALDPSPKALERILVWFRNNIHPQCLLQIGLQPTIAVGCVLRTPNKIFDMSMRSYLKQQEPYLVQLIAGASRGH